MSESAYNRRPVKVLELRQPRCALRFGVSPCTATAALGTRCYNTRTTCLDPDNYDATGAFISWRFTTVDSFVPDLYAEAGEHIRTNAIPCLVDVRTQPTRVNVAAARDGQSPFGVRSTLDATMQDIAWDDHVGDFYAAERSNAQPRTFWAAWRARNAFTSQMTLRLYEGYEGQALEAMQSRLFVLDKIEGPDASGRVRLHGVDPLQLSDRRRALFPRATRVRLVGDIDATATVITVTAAQADLDDAFGNTGSTRYLRAGDEIVSYTGFTAAGDDWTLTGVTRGALNTEAQDHTNNANFQRVGHYVNLPLWSIAYDLLTNHTRVTTCTGCPAASSFIDQAQWDSEGGRWLPVFVGTGTVTEPTPVADLIGELSQQGQFSVWWDERTQRVPLLAIRPPEGDPALLNDRDHIMPGATVKDEPEGRYTRVLMYYQRRNPTRSLDDVGNYERAELRADVEFEAPELGGDVRTKVIFSRWHTSLVAASQFVGRFLVSTKQTPRYLTISLDAKDRALTIGNIAEVTTRTIVDTQGSPTSTLWQVISENETRPGETIVYDLQTYGFLGRFGVYRADGSPNYGAATDEQKKEGSWYAANNGRLGDGSLGYQYG
jgi:hypothetical protein